MKGSTTRMLIDGAGKLLILGVLADGYPRTVAELSAALGISREKTNGHLSRMSDSKRRQVTREWDGRRYWYTITDKGHARLAYQEQHRQAEAEAEPIDFDDPAADVYPEEESEWEPY